MPTLPVLVMRMRSVTAAADTVLNAKAPDCAPAVLASSVVRAYLCHPICPVALRGGFSMPSAVSTLCSLPRALAFPAAFS